MEAPKLTAEMARVLVEAKQYGDWFSASHHFMAPVRARHQTLKGLYNRGYLDCVHESKPRNKSAGSETMYRYASTWIFFEQEEIERALNAQPTNNPLA